MPMGDDSLPWCYRCLVYHDHARMLARKAEAWASCCRASNHLADLVCLMYHPGDDKARKTWPTATWAEIIASELGIEIPETE